MYEIPDPSTSPSLISHDGFCGRKAPNQQDPFLKVLHFPASGGDRNWGLGVGRC